MTTASPEPVADAELDDLRRRLRDTRPVRLPAVRAWERGTDPAYLAELLEYWADGYDWRTHEHRIAALPWERSAAGPTIHQRAGDDAPAVLLLHGWPDSVLRFERVLPLLTDVNLVVPPLPGYPFADPVDEVGTSSTDIAERMASLMAHLGYDRYVVSGGDIGSMVGEQLAHRHREHVTALHLTDVPFGHLFTIGDDDLSAAERDYLERGRRWSRREGAYAQLHSTKPHTLAVGLGDSPAGLAAWIVEKLRSWTDSDGDVESVFTRDELLTWISAYWFTDTIGTSFGPYVERAEPVPYVDVPTAVTIFPRDLVTAPRDFAERFFDVRSWNEQPDGGHFGAWERPEVYVEQVRATLAL